MPGGGPLRCQKTVLRQISLSAFFDHILKFISLTSASTSSMFAFPRRNNTFLKFKSLKRQNPFKILHFSSRDVMKHCVTLSSNFFVSKNIIQNPLSTSIRTSFFLSSGMLDFALGGMAMEIWPYKLVSLQAHKYFLSALEKVTQRITRTKVCEPRSRHRKTFRVI